MDPGNNTSKVELNSENQNGDCMAAMTTLLDQWEAEKEKGKSAADTFADSVELLCAARTLTAWKELASATTESQRADEDNHNDGKQQNGTTEDTHSDTASSPHTYQSHSSAVASDSHSNPNSVSPHHPHEPACNETTSDCPVTEYKVEDYESSEPDQEKQNYIESTIKEEEVEQTFRPSRNPYIGQAISIKTDHDPLIFEGAKFSSFVDFSRAFEEWKQLYYHPFRVASSETLRQPDGSVYETFKYRYIVYHCAHYGNPRMRGNGKRPNQNYLPCGCKAMMRLNYNYHDNALRVTLLKERHDGHELSAEGFARVSAKVRKLSPNDSVGEASPGSSSVSSFTVKSQDSPNMTECSSSSQQPTPFLSPKFSPKCSLNTSTTVTETHASKDHVSQLNQLCQTMAQHDPSQMPQLSQNFKPTNSGSYQTQHISTNDSAFNMINSANNKQHEILAALMLNATQQQQQASRSISTDSPFSAPNRSNQPNIEPVTPKVVTNPPIISGFRSQATPNSMSSNSLMQQNSQLVSLLQGLLNGANVGNNVPSNTNVTNNALLGSLMGTSYSPAVTALDSPQQLSHISNNFACNSSHMSNNRQFLPGNQQSSQMAALSQAQLLQSIFNKIKGSSQPSVRQSLPREPESFSLNKPMTVQTSQRPEIKAETADVASKDTELYALLNIMKEAEFLIQCLRELLFRTKDVPAFIRRLREFVETCTNEAFLQSYM
ncbi:hypothetical protein Ddc_07821 [Ditylenchus destructor]|nr:hypothetical protein Ddc_07821 [Ditylenchus destructor]